MEAKKKQAKDVISSLIEKYKDVLKKRKEDDFLEEYVKIKFINPLLIGLGWDIERIDEVKFEQKTPRGHIDLALRTDATSPPEILFEVKAFRENLDGYRVVAGKKQSYPKKAIDDAWSLKVDYCVLTNFKELRLYYTKVKNPKDGLIFKLTYTEYMTDNGFEKIWSLSKENIESGFLERFEKKRTREDISTEIVNELFTLRKILMHTIHKENILDSDELKESVQRILDRLVVIRVAEDRGVIHAESLSEMISTWKKTAINKSVRTLMKDLKNLFRDFDAAYNSKLFEEHFCEDLTINNEVLKNVVETLYNYNFELIDADVLGSIYEEYIGHILSEEPELDIVEDLSIRKESGVYYTHTSIVEYIVRNTLGKYLQEVSDPSHVSKITVIDPACGSGSFLIKAFDFIEKWYDTYNQKIIEAARQDGSLTPYNNLVNNHKQKIIADNLFGVDLDLQATEIASMNLILKALRKGEKLPEIMGENVKCGNSLIQDKKEDPLACMWDTEFKKIMNEGGFDICIGNPPWGADLSQNANYLEKVYNLAEGQYDSYELFIELSKKILKDSGIWGFVIPDSIFNPEHEPLRKFLCLKNQIEKIIKLGEGFFKGVYRSSVIIIFKKKKPQKSHLISVFTLMKEDRKNLMAGKTSISGIEREKGILIPQKRFAEDKNFTFDITKSIDDEKIMEKMESNRLSWNKIVETSRGVEFSQRGLVIQCPHCFNWDNPPRKRKGKYDKKECSHCGVEYEFDEALKKECIVSKERKRGETDKLFIKGKSVNRYYTDQIEYLNITKNGINYKEPSLYKGPKILIRKTGVGIYATIDYTGAYVPQVVFIFKLKEKIPSEYKDLKLEYILGVLNSRIILYYYYKKFGEIEWKSFPYITPKVIKMLPLPDIDFSNPEKRKIHDIIAEKVSDILHERGDFDKLDYEIEKLVMDLFGITAEMKPHIWKELRNVQKLRIIREVMN
ncbi:MAG: N-6 DNA methylase [Candidatus Methanofastidiosia archaeon]